MKTALQTVGVVGLIAWTATGLFAWSKVQERVRVVVTPDNSAELDEQTLLADRIGSLSSDLDALVAALEVNFGRVAEAIERGQDEAALADARALERLRLLEESVPHALQAREEAGALAVVLRRLEALAAVGTATPVVATEPVHSPPELLAVASADPGAPLSSDLAPVEPLRREAAPPAEAPKPRSFLAFDLPSRDFVFEGTQSFQILPDLSRVGFDAESTLHDFSGVSKRVKGSVRLDLARPEAGCSGSITVEAASLNTDLEGRDEAMADHLEVSTYPSIEFVPSGFEATAIDAAAKTVQGRVSGTLTVHGVERDVQMACKAHVDDSRRLVIEGEMPLLMTDYGIEVPSQLGVISVEDEVRVWIHLRARSSAGAVGE